MSDDIESDDPHQLLKEWMHWWSSDDRAPAKLPNALQVRTAVALVIHDPEWRPPNPDPVGVFFETLGGIPDSE